MAPDWDWGFFPPFLKAGGCSVWVARPGWEASARAVSAWEVFAGAASADHYLGFPIHPCANPPTPSPPP